MAERTLSRTTSGVVSAQPGYYTGYVVTTATSAATILIYDNASAASGTIIDAIPVSQAIGAKSIFAKPIAVKNGIYASFGGTGTVTFIFD